MTAYATRADVFKFGLPRGKLSNPSRLCGTVLAATNAFELDGHGFATDDVLVFRAEGNDGVLPAPLVAGTSYYAINVNEQVFKVAAAAAGAAIDLTTDGVSVLVTSELPFEDVLEFYSRFVDAFLPAHLVPLTAPYPIVVTAHVATLAAKRLLLIAEQSSASMADAELGAKAQLERWAAGIPLRDARATGPANLAYSQSVVVDPRGWAPPGGTLP